MSNKYGHRTHNWFEAIVNKLGGEERADRFLRGELSVVEVKGNLLEDDIGTITMTRTSDKFIACEKFVVNIGQDAPAKINHISGDFVDWFLLCYGKIEDPICGKTLRRSKLLKDSLDTSIIAELGGEEKSETTLTEIFSLIKNQKNGEFGVLLASSRINIFYVRDQNGVFRTVIVSWGGYGWDINAEVPNLHRWRAGTRVFSRNFSGS